MVDILIVEDNIEIAELLRTFLVEEGYNVKTASSGEDAMDIFYSNSVKLVILDVMLKNMDGFAVCTKIREDSNVPVLIISAKTDKDSKINGLVAGADDYIEKPFDIDIMLAKIKGIFKRRYQSENITEGNITIDKAKKIVYKDGKQLDMTSKEYELLLLLIENKGNTLKKEYLFNRIWGYDSESELQTLTVHIKWLRKKIEEDEKNPKRICTVWGTGYRFE